MFRYEKDMIPAIKIFFKEKLNQVLSVEEFNTGIGIADIVFAKSINERNYYFDSFHLLYHTINLLNRRNKKISKKDLIARFSRKQVDNIIKKYIAMKLIEENNSYYYVKNKLSPSVTEFYAVEAKLKDWKSGFYQALRYKNFAHKSFLALSSDYIHRVDKNLLVQYNIGLISVSPDHTKIIINPKKQSPNDKIAFYYLGEQFTKNIFIDQHQINSSQQWL